MPEQLHFTVPADYDQKQAKLFLKGYCGLSTRMITSLKRETEGIVSNGKILRTVDTPRRTARHHHAAGGGKPLYRAGGGRTGYCI